MLAGVTSPRVRLRAEIEALKPYRQGKPAAADAHKLSSNENPFEPLPAVLAAIVDASADINRYPDSTAAALREVLATKYSVTADQVVVGAGSVSLLSQFISAAASTGDEVVYSWRSFEAYPGLVTVAGATSVTVPNRPDQGHDLPAMVAAITDKTRVIIVCSPNNPTGTIVTKDEFAAFMAQVPPTVLVLLDEAYIEFVTDETAVRGIPLLAEYPNLVVLRTFSKAYGLAGLRIGYAIAAEYLIDAARAASIPLAVIGSAQAAALASLAHESELMERVGRITLLRDHLWQALIDQGWDIPKPSGNFLWLSTGDYTATAAEIFAEAGVIVRALGDGIRVSIGEPSAVDKLLRASAEVVRNL
ncbi:MAG: aminotransferase [Glaciihabitans sp.]|nr:aminotransferase [Glaciihabitans sp.]